MIHQHHTFYIFITLITHLPHTLYCGGILSLGEFIPHYYFKKTKKVRFKKMSQEEFDFSDIIPYPFMLSDEKGKKAAVRFRENIRRYYNPDLNLSEGLTIKDQAILQLFSYDQDTDVGFCRIYSKTHDGPMFANVTDLYNTYNLSGQGHPQDVFQYAGSDDDRGMELGEFLRQNEIRKSSELTPDQLARFEAAVSRNPMKLGFEAAVAAKKKKKAEEMEAAKKRSEGAAQTSSSTSGGGSGSGGGAGGGSGEEGGDEEDQANKKKPGRPKGTKVASPNGSNSGPNGGTNGSAPISVKRPRDTTGDADNTSPSSSTMSGASMSGSGGRSATTSKSSNLADKKARNSSGLITPTGLVGGPSGATGSTTYPLLDNFHLDHSNIDNSTAYLQYEPQGVRLGDLPPNSIARQAMCWRLFSHIVAAPNAWLLGPTNDPEAFLREVVEGKGHEAPLSNP
jgi:hypothetical protein